MNNGFKIETTLQFIRAPRTKIRDNDWGKFWGPLIQDKRFLYFTQVVNSLYIFYSRKELTSKYKNSKTRMEKNEEAS